MSRGSWKLGDFCPIWLRGWMVHWYDSPTAPTDSSSRRRAGHIYLLWHFGKTRQRTYVFEAFSPHGESILAGSALSLKDARTRIRNACKQAAAKIADSPSPKP